MDPIKQLHVLLFLALLLGASRGLQQPRRGLKHSRPSRCHQRAGATVVVHSGAAQEEELRSQLAAKNKNLGDLPLSAPAALFADTNIDSTLMAKLMGRKPYFEVIADKLVETVDDIYFDAINPNAAIAEREKVVVLGSGWGAHAFVSSLDAAKYEATIVSPRNFFLFTPMLAGAAVGTVEYRSITQPIREANEGVDYLEASATAIDVERQEVACQAVTCEGSQCSVDGFSLRYDHLIVAVGAGVNTFGIPGVKEHCFFLKQVEDAARLRRAIGNCFERANFPGLTEAQKVSALTFAVIGAGPTGVEFVAELCDFIEQDVPRFYPKLAALVRVKLIEASSRVLVAFDAALQAQALDTLAARTSGGEPLVEVLLEAGVKEVMSEKILLSSGDEVPFGLSVWAAGIAPLPLVSDLAASLPEQAAMQGEARGKLVVDNWLRLIGTANVWSIGDCAMVEGENYPATAQVASQQGAFLARLFSRNWDLTQKVPARVGRSMGLAQALALGEAGCYAKGFAFLNLGILAYLGDSQALAQIQVDDQTIKGSGVAGFALWRSVYLSKQVSWRNRVLVFVDWLKTRAFGRDLTRL